MYISKKRFIEIFFWLGVFTLSAITNATSYIMEEMRSHIPVTIWKPFLWEFSSAAVILLLIPCILYIDQRIPIASKNWPKRLMIHLPLSMIFSLLHISGMFAIRKLVYASVGEYYNYGNLGWVFLYEYRKDFGTYIVIMLAIYAYREINRLRNGEAQLPRSENDEDNDRILVSKGGHYHFIEMNSVEWVEAAGNYVELHAGAETYMLRSTMKEIESRLGNDKFSRIHRSTIVRRDQVTQVSSAMNGDKILTLKSHEEFRLSRRYRQNFEI